jgi:iron-sulfur cluster repair protein YtfE (RIC family)
LYIQDSDQKTSAILTTRSDGIRIAELPEANSMNAKRTTTQTTPCGSPLPDLEAPMISTMVMCLGSEHTKLNSLGMQLAFAATRVVNNPGETSANQQALQLWDEIRHDLWSHLQIEDELVFSWGEAHHAIPITLLDILKNERNEMRELMASLRALSPGVDSEPQTAEDHSRFAQTLLALARILDSHFERYDGEVLPSILRALFHR